MTESSGGHLGFKRVTLASFDMRISHLDATKAVNFLML